MQLGKPRLNRRAARSIAEHSRADRVLLVDCLTLWLTNMLLAEEDLATAGNALAAAITDAPGPVVLVSNEVGFGIVPDNALARRFRDAQGTLNQRLAQTCDATDRSGLSVHRRPQRIVQAYVKSAGLRLADDQHDRSRK